MSEELKPCPFCGAGKFDITEAPLNRTPSMDGRPSPIISASVRHWCEPKDRHPRGLNVSVHGYDRASAIAAWNRRAPMTAPTPAGEEGDLIEWCERQVQLRDYAEFMKDGVDRDRILHERNRFKSIAALLSSPRVERARALEEAAKVAEEFAESHRKPPHHNDTFWTAMNLAKAIRSLSLTDGAPANPAKVRTP